MAHDNTAPRMGRRPLYEESLERFEIMVPPQWRAAARAAAKRRGVTVSQVFRDWIEKGRKRK